MGLGGERAPRRRRARRAAEALALWKRISDASRLSPLQPSLWDRLDSQPRAAELAGVPVDGPRGPAGLALPVQSLELQPAARRADERRRLRPAAPQVRRQALPLTEHDATAAPHAAITPISFDALAEDLHAVWAAPTTDARLKKRIVRTVIQEAVADLNDATAEIVLTIHWIGGAHTEHRLPRRRRGQRNSTPDNVVEAVRALALIAKDDVIAGILNRNCLKTGNGNRWTRERATSMRNSHQIPVYRPAEDGREPWLNVTQAAASIVGVAAPVPPP